jgi:hypothetical protein
VPADATSAPGRNDPCHCGSGRKYKHCCLAKDEAAAREARARSVESASADAPAEAEPVKKAPPKQTHQPWKRGAQNTKGFGKVSLPRKVGGS